MKEAFIAKRFNRKTIEIIGIANAIIDEYHPQGYVLTLRQLYYQFVARGYIRNNIKSYKNLGNMINDGRLAGLIDWESIADRTRHSRSLPHWNAPEEIIEGAAQQYRIDKWEGAKHYVEIWVEKDSLIEIVQRISQEFDVTCFSCRGYSSQSAMYDAAKRFLSQGEYLGKTCHLIHLGDHDPSGTDMTRDIDFRLQLFGTNVEIIRAALNIDQVRMFDPPPNPAKTTDSRYQKYVDEFGLESWELDALNPNDLANIIRTTIKPFVNQKLFKTRVKLQEEQRQKIRDVIHFFSESEGEET